jgi:putative FmdB family regulatory protein
VPLYEYQCEGECGRFELIQKFADPPLQACPRCGRPVHKLLSAPAIQFKGSGWYITDYARKGSGESKSDTSSKSEKSAGSSEKSSGSSDGGSSKTTSKDGAASGSGGTK